MKVARTVLRGEEDIRQSRSSSFYSTDDEDKELVKMAESKNKTLQRARVEMNYLTGDAAVRRLAELREKWEMDYASGMAYAKKEGMTEGREERQKSSN